MVRVIWRSDPIANSIGMEARIIEVDGERTLEARFSNDLTLVQKLKAIVDIIKGRSTTISTIYIGSNL